SAYYYTIHRNVRKTPCEGECTRMFENKKIIRQEHCPCRSVDYFTSYPCSSIACFIWLSVTWFSLYVTSAEFVFKLTETSFTPFKLLRAPSTARLQWSHVIPLILNVLTANAVSPPFKAISSRKEEKRHDTGIWYTTGFKMSSNGAEQTKKPLF